VLTVVSQCYQQEMGSSGKNTTTSGDDPRVPYLDNPSDPAEYISAGIIQTFTPPDSTTTTNKALPPLHEQVILSELKDMIKKDSRYFKDD